MSRSRESAYSSESSSRFQQLKDNVTDISYKTLDTFNAQPLWRRLIVIVMGVIFAILGLFVFIYRETAFEYIVEYSDIWGNDPKVPFILCFCIFLTGFPPLLGFSFFGAVTGVLYGISFKGWFIMFVGSVTGSAGAFLLFRLLLKKRAQELVASNDKLYAFSSVLNDGKSYLILALIRVCPFPYSFTNGALAGIPGVSLSHFVAGSVISSPKLLVYLFVGQKIKNMGEAKSTTERIVDLLTILITGAVLGLTGWVLFSKTSKRLREIENDRMMEHERYGDEENVIDNEFELDDDLDDERTVL